MTSLPPHLPKDLVNNPQAVTVYEICLALERSLQETVDAGRNLVYIRILGYLIHFVPGTNGLATVAEEITSCNNDSTLLELGRRYYDCYLRAFRPNKGRTPAPSNHPSRPSFDTLADMINDTLKTAPLSHATAKKQALIRDGFRCVITGEYDWESVNQVRELRDKYNSDPNLRRRLTQCTHIFPASANVNIDPGTPKRRAAATMWAVMTRFGYETLPGELNGPKVHRLENVMTMDTQYHNLFDELLIWFVATKEENKYKLEGVDTRGYPEYVTFTTQDPVNLPVPSPNYLAIHAACAKVAHLSGAAECIDKFNQDMEDKNTLDPDGASANMLEEALRQLE